MIDINVLEMLNAPTKEERLANLKKILPQTQFPPMVPQYINNHIHTTYSFSPYSPTAAVYAARMEGLCTAGIIDHDSISGAREFLEADRARKERINSCYCKDPHNVGIFLLHIFRLSCIMKLSILSRS